MCSVTHSFIIDENWQNQNTESSDKKKDSDSEKKGRSGI